MMEKLRYMNPYVESAAHSVLFQMNYEFLLERVRTQ